MIVKARVMTASPSSTPLPKSLPAWSERPDTAPSTRLLMVLGTAVVAMTAWAATFEVDKVTRGSGRVLPMVQNQMVQNLEGGIVSEILVREGQRVKRGDVLMRLSNQFTNAELSNAQTDVVARRIALARMDAESRGASSFTAPAELARLAPSIAASEEALFSSRRSQVNQELATLDDRIRALKSELSALDQRIANLRTEEGLMLKQLSSLERALAAEAVSESDVMERRQSLQQLRTRMADASNQIPQTRAELGEAEGRRREAWLRFVSENKERGAEIRLQLAKAGEALGAFQDRDRRANLQAPMDGVVNKVFVQTVGGVVQPGQDLVEIVPVDSSVIIEARVDPEDRGKIWPGLPATVKVSAYEFSVHGGLSGEVVDISADALQDPEGKTYYRVRLKADTSRFGTDRPVMPGMTAEVDIKSGSQTVLQYILSPVRRVSGNAFQE